MRFAYHSLLVLGALLLAACSSAPVVGPADPNQSEIAARTAVERGDYPTARNLYQELARRSEGMQRAAFQIELARIDLALGQLESALGELDSTPPELTEALESERSALRAQVFFGVGRTSDAVRLLVEREIWLDSAEQILDNQTRIWDGLQEPLSLTAAQSPSGDSTIDGWLALAPLTRLNPSEAEFREALTRWNQAFPNHPATGGILAERLALARGPGLRPTRIAVLLPLTEQPVFSLAIQAGIFAGHLLSENVEDTTIRFYDTSQGRAVESFLAAQLDADFVVGPLLEQDVTAVRAQTAFVPTLALNLPANEIEQSKSNFYQFALSSDDEIEAIAARAIRDGHRTAVTLHASSARGRRLANRFTEAFESRGGRVLNSTEYVAGNAASDIRYVLNITQSENRHRRLQANLGRAVEFEPRRRADIDMVFLQADPGVGPGNARLLVPLLENNGAGPEDVPIYATSEIHDATRTALEPDLNGLIFPDIPFLVAPDGTGRTVRSQFEEFTLASAASQPRLFAFGYDAYQLIEALYAAGNTRWPIAGATGELYLGENGRIRRVLPFASFQGGRPASLSPSLGVFGSR